MSENTQQPHEEDPGASTAMFRAFVDEGAGQAAPAKKLSNQTLAFVAGVIVLLVVILAIVLL